VHHEGFLVWHAKERQVVHRTGVNIWRSPKASVLAQRNFEAMQGDYAHAGFVILSTQLIEARLAASTYIPGDLALLRQGREVFVQSPCGCTVRHARNGDWEIVETGCSGAHAGLSEAIWKFEAATPVEGSVAPQKPHVEIVSAIPPREESLGSHGGCGGDIMRVAIEQKTVVRKGKPYARFQVEEYCTSCGYAPFTDYSRLADVPLAG